MGPRKRTLMNEEFENLLYSHFWTEKIQDHWAQLMKDNNYDHKHYLQAFVGCVLYTLGVYRQADTLGKVFNNSWSFKSVKETSLSNVKVHKCYRRLLKADVVTTIFKEMPDMKPFLLWLVRNQDVAKYCGLCNDFPEEGSPETEDKPSAKTRFKKLLEYTNNNVDSLTLDEVLTLIKNRNYRGRKGQEEDNDCDDSSASQTPSPNTSNAIIMNNNNNNYNNNTQNDSYNINYNNNNNSFINNVGSSSNMIMAYNNTSNINGGSSSNSINTNLMNTAMQEEQLKLQAKIRKEMLATEEMLINKKAKDGNYKDDNDQPPPYSQFNN